MKSAVSTGMFVLLTGIYLFLSGAPLRVHVLSVACFAIAFWVPALLASTPKALRRRWFQCVLLGIGGMILWDWAKALVIAKAGSLDILTRAPWVYIVGLVALGSLRFLSACIGSLLANAQADGPQRA